MAQNLFLGGKAWQAKTLGAGIVDVTTASRFNATYGDSAISFPLNGIANFQFTDDSNTPLSAAAGDVLEARFDIYLNYNGSNNLIRFLNASEQPLVRLAASDNFGTLRIEHNTGTLAVPVWTALGATIPLWIANTSLQTVNIKLTIDAGSNHRIQLFRNNTLIADRNFTNSLLTELQFISFMCTDNGGGVLFISQLFVAKNKDLIGSFVASLRASGAGSNSGMTGAFGDVNEAVASDATLVTSGTAGQRTTFAITDLPALPANTVVGSNSRHVMRARATGAPGNLRSVIRQGGVDTVSANLPGIASGFNPLHFSYNLTEAQINAAGFELGFESAT